MNICIIPARGGSKRIPQKNKRLFCDKPIITYSITNALKAALFDKIIVSSDDSEILEIAINLGVEALHRPSNLSDDYTTTHAVIIHGIETLKPRLQDWVCCLYATAPLIEPRNLQEAFKLAQSHSSTYTLSAVEFDYTPFRSFTLEDNRAKMLFSEYFTQRSQDLPKVFHDAGAFYFATSKRWLENANMFENSTPYILPPLDVQDIDTLQDWEIAELKYRLKHKIP